MKTFKREGLLGLYKGLLSPMLGEMVNCCLLFGCYGILNQLMTSDDIWTIGNKGMIAGLASTLVLSPVELIKIRLQLDTDPKRGTIGRQGFMDCVRHTVRQPGGIRNLFQGFQSFLKFLIYRLQYHSFARSAFQLDILCIIRIR